MVCSEKVVDKVDVCVVNGNSDKGKNENVTDCGTGGTNKLHVGDNVEINENNVKDSDENASKNNNMVENKMHEDRQSSSKFADIVKASKLDNRLVWSLLNQVLMAMN